ncbi:hypothetical protein DMH17_13770 [Raoultella planticola]|nr:hypothetical protein [Raoultella planticola]
MTMHHSDVILCRRRAFDDRTTNNLAKYCPNATVLHIDIDPTSISKTVPADVPIVGDARQVLDQMLELLEQEERSRWMRSATGGSRSSRRARHCNTIRKAARSKPQAVIETHLAFRPAAMPTSPPMWVSTRCLPPFTILSDKPRRWI